MFIINFIFGLVIIAIGAAGIKYNAPIVHMFGQNNWFERKLGQGMTFFVYQLLALLVIAFGFLMMASLHDNVLDFLLAPLNSLSNV